MKLCKKLVGLLLTAIMVLGMVTTAFAAGEDGTGTITITNATKEHTYAIYQIFEANPSGKDDDVVAYTATETQKNWFEAQAGNPFAFTENIAGSYNVSVGTHEVEGEQVPYTETEVIAFLQGFYTEETEGDTTTPVLDTGFAAQVEKKDEQIATDTTLTFADVPYGYYLVTSSLGAIITVDSTNPNASIVDKNQDGPTWDEDGGKTVVGSTIADVVDRETGEVVRETSANYGDELEFQVCINTTNYAGESKITNYYINDTLASGMSYVMDGNQIKATVKVGADELTDDKYTLTYDEDNNSFKLVIPWVGENGDALYVSPNNITVTYSAVVGTDAVIAGEGNSNTATFDYTVEGEKEPTHESDKQTVTTYTYALAINKIDPKGNGLAGATFTLRDEEGNQIPVIGGEDGVYQYDVADYTDPSVPGEPNYNIVSPDNGLIVVKGVAAGTYTLTETKAPDGYNPLTETKEITASIESTSTYTTTITIYKDADGNVVDEQIREEYNTTVVAPANVTAINVINNAGSQLPSTGGIGTTIFYVLGAVIVVGAAVILVVRRRMSAEK